MNVAVSDFYPPVCSATMEARLLVTHGKANVKKVTLGPQTVIGRAPECNLRIASSQVSRRHCRLTVTDSEVFVCDLGSANGTLLNGKPLPREIEVAVAPGDALFVGPLKFVVEYQPPPALSAREAEAAAIRELAIAQGVNEEETVDYPLARMRRGAKPADPPPEPIAPEPFTDEGLFESAGPAVLEPALAAAVSPVMPAASEVVSPPVEPPPVNPIQAATPVDVAPPAGSADTIFDRQLASLPPEAPFAAAEPVAPPVSESGEAPESTGNTEVGTEMLFADLANPPPAGAAEPAAHESPFDALADEAGGESPAGDDADEPRRESLASAARPKKRGLFDIFRRGKKAKAKGKAPRPADEDPDEEDAAPPEMTLHPAHEPDDAGDDGGTIVAVPHSEPPASPVPPPAVAHDAPSDDDDDALNDFLKQF